MSDSQWLTFCEAVGSEELGADPALARSNDRVAEREKILPLLRERFAAMTRNKLVAQIDPTGLPYVPIQRPLDLLDDEHMIESSALLAAPTRRSAMQRWTDRHLEQPA